MLFYFAMPLRSVADTKSRISKACSTENVL
jgi:hypothetical protein